MPDRSAVRPTVALDIEDGVARITLDRPDAGNAIDLVLAEALADATTRLRADPSLRVVVLRGAGSRFCVGGDLRSFRGRDDLPEHLARITAPLHQAVSDLALVPVPVVCGVQGSIAGAGVGLAASADVTIAAESARFVLAYTAIGLTPDGGVSWHLPRLVGQQGALDLALTNRPLGAEEARALGLVARVVADDELDREVEAVTEALRDGPTRALGATKRLLRAASGRDLEAQLAFEREALSAAAADDGAEGIAAFLDKRQPRFC